MRDLFGIFFFLMSIILIFVLCLLLSIYVPDAKLGDESREMCHKEIDFFNVRYSCNDGVFFLSNFNFEGGFYQLIEINYQGNLKKKYVSLECKINDKYDQITGKLIFLFFLIFGCFFISFYFLNDGFGKIEGVALLTSVMLLIYMQYAFLFPSNCYYGISDWTKLIILIITSIILMASYEILESIVIGSLYLLGGLILIFFMAIQLIIEIFEISKFGYFSLIVYTIILVSLGILSVGDLRHRN